MLLIVLLLVQGAFANPPTTKAIQIRCFEIEQRFGLKFMEVVTGGQRDDGSKYSGWAFSEHIEGMHIPEIRFIVPEFATDEQVRSCKDAAEYASGWYEGYIRKLLSLAAEQRKKEAQEQLNPTPAPTPEYH